MDITKYLIMEQNNHDKLYDILLNIREDLGGLKADNSSIKDDINRIKEQFKTLNGSVARHSSFINVWKGKMLVISSGIAIFGSLVTSWIKKYLID